MHYRMRITASSECCLPAFRSTLKFLLIPVASVADHLAACTDFVVRYVSRFENNGFAPLWLPTALFGKIPPTTPVASAVGRGASSEAPSGLPPLPASHPCTFRIFQSQLQFPRQRIHGLASGWLCDW